MLDYVTEFITHLQSIGLARGTIKYRKYAINFLYSYIKKEKISINDNECYSAIMENFYTYLLSYRYVHKNYVTREYIKKSLSRTTLSKIMYAIRSYYYFLHDKQLIYKNPFDKINISTKSEWSIKSEVKESDIEKLISVIDCGMYRGFRDRTIIELLYCTGLRRNEITRLDVHDIDFGQGIIHVRYGKGKKQRLIPIGEVAIGFVKEYISEVRRHLISIENLQEPALFISIRGTRLVCDVIGCIVQKYARLAGCPHITTHKLRHAFALHMIRRGCDIRYIQEILGHADLETTTIYTQIYNSDLKEKIAKYHPGNHCYMEKLNRITDACSGFAK